MRADTDVLFGLTLMNQKHRVIKPYKASSQSSIPVLPIAGDGISVGGKSGVDAVSLLGRGGTNPSNASIFSGPAGNGSAGTIQSSKHIIGGIQQVQTMNSNEKLSMTFLKGPPCNFAF